jgi:endonuclease YncB( thermonuclease family)
MHRAARSLLGAAIACALIAVVGVRAQETTKTAETCTLSGGPTRSVVRVIDSETVLLDDQTEARLIGALAPRSPDLSSSAQAWMPETRAIEALKALVGGKSVSLATAGRGADRYGRKFVHLFVEMNGERVWVQGKMLSSGNARAYGLPGSYACISELMAHEKAARDVGVGLWGHAAYAVRSARATRDLLRRRNSYEIVAGTVANVTATKARTYINFGANWRSDFTAGIETRVLRADPVWAKSLEGLKGRRVEVRGWIQYRNGPYIDVEDPSQIAPVDPALPGRSPPPPSEATTSSKREEHEAPEKEERPAPTAPGALDL